MKSPWILLALALLLALPLTARESPAKPHGILIAEAAGKFLEALDDSQKAKAALPFTSPERENFRFTPRDRAGLPLKEMTDAQRGAAMTLLDSTLSEKGKLKAAQIMILESVLAELEKNPTYRDDGKYFVAIFGTPGDPTGWGWRFEGHHLSFNLTFVDGKPVSATPTFLGSNPGEVHEGQHKGLRVLAAEEDLARTLVSTLVAAGKSNAIFSPLPPAEILSAEQSTATALDPVGIAAADMTEAQRSALLTLISEYTGRYRPEIAEADMKKIQAAGIDKIRFGWAGGTEPGNAYYYRIQGPTFLMEAANVQNNANHVHATWRDFQGDFGRDLLREHYRGDH